MIIPSIDLMNGKAVQLQQGKKKILEVEDPLKLAYEFRKYGEIAVIDLDAALGKGENTQTIKKICEIADCRVGGGIRSFEKAIQILQAGAHKIIIGTKATPEFLSKLPRDKIIVAIDTKNGTVATHGWTKESDFTPEEKIKELEPYCSEFLFTDVIKEGMMQGIDLELIQKIVAISANVVTIAGGITTYDDVLAIEKLNANSQIGMAIYTNSIQLPKLFTSVLDFQKGNGLIPTIVQDESNQVLMLAYSSRESLLKTFELNLATYYSRSRQTLWTKGKTSGHLQHLKTVRYDCDRDTLLFTVEQKTAACHTNQYSCFESKRFSFNDIYENLTKRLKIDEKMNRKKLIEQISDELYAQLELMAKNNISPAVIINELWRRELND